MVLLNHQHLYYFWMAIKEGSITKAAKKLFLSQSTLSGQIIQLEKSLGHRLLERHKTRLVLTEEGKIVIDHANEIFNTTQELLSSLKGKNQMGPTDFSIGIDDNMSKQISEKILLAIFDFNPQIQVKAISGDRASLFNQLQLYSLDLIVTDEESSNNDAFITQQVGRLRMFFAAAPQVAKEIRDFPKDLAKVRLLLPSSSSPITASIERFLSRRNIKPLKKSSIQDIELIRMMALRGKGVAPLHEITASQEIKEKKLVEIGRSLDEIVKTIWLVARARRQQHPVAVHLIENFRL